MKRQFGEGSPEEAVGDFDYQAKLAAIQRNPGKTRILVGDRPVWVTACSWETGGRRCRMAASIADYCAWHSHATQDLRWSSDRAEFDRWVKVVGRWQGDLDYLWGKVMGYADL